MGYSINENWYCSFYYLFNTSIMVVSQWMVINMGKIIRFFNQEFTLKVWQWYLALFTVVAIESIVICIVVN